MKAACLRINCAGSAGGGLWAHVSKSYKNAIFPVPGRTDKFVAGLRWSHTLFLPAQHIEPEMIEKKTTRAKKSLFIYNLLFFLKKTELEQDLGRCKCVVLLFHSALAMPGNKNPI